MTYLLTMQLLFLFAGTAMAAVLATHAWLQRPARGSRAFAALMAAVGVWSAASALAAAGPGWDAGLAWAAIRFLGAVTVPVGWLLLALHITGRRTWLSRRRLPVVWLVPALTLVLAASNAGHGLVWQTSDVAEAARPGLIWPTSDMALPAGVWSWIQVAFGQALLWLAAYCLWQRWQQQARRPGWQSAAGLAGLMLPAGAALLAAAGLTAVDLTPAAFVFTGLWLARSTLGYPLFELNPAAHQAAVTSMEDAVLVLDTRDRVVDANPAAARALAPGQAGLVGREIHRVWPALAQRLNGQGEKVFELLSAHDDARFFEVSVSPIRDWQEALQGRLLIIRDITPRKEKELLRQDLTRSMVHDLRAPISNTLFALEMLKGDLDGVASAEHRLLLDMTFTNTEKTLQLVNQILEYQRLESGQMPLALAAVSLFRLVPQVLHQLGATAADRQVTLVSQVPADLPLAWADQDLLGRVLQNLVDNAIRYSPAGGAVTVSARQVTAARPGRPAQLLISVADEGPGIPAELQARLFERYVTGEGGGTGLGLFVCRTALAAHGQTIWVDSPPGHGAVFHFTLAAAEAGPAGRAAVTALHAALP